MRLVLISDTHGLHPTQELPEGDVLVHAGDFCNGGSFQDCVEYCIWLKNHIDKYKVVVQIAGNHDFCTQNKPEEVKKEFKNWFSDKLVYLCDEAFEFSGLKFYGSPWQPWFLDWAWNLPRGEKLAEVWSKIPADTDVLITHGPPYGILDKVRRGSENVGCKDLLAKIKSMQNNLLLHVFGHIHETHGIYENKDFVTKFVNASICTDDYRPINKPIVVDVHDYDYKGKVAYVVY